MHPPERLPIDIGELLVAAAAMRRREPDRPVETVGEDDLPLGSAAPIIEQLRAILDHGAGAAVVTGFPVAQHEVETMSLAFWRLGLELGRPVSQSVMGDRLGHVIDATDTDPHARAYRRNERLSPHTDPVDHLAFLCISPAAEGGANHLADSRAIHDALERDHPDLLVRLRRGYRYHRFGEQGPDDDPITPYRVPVFSTCDGHLSCTYVRQYIEIAAAEDPSCALDDLDRRALDTFEELATRPEFSTEVTLAAGDALFANNFTVLHARTAFRDVADGPRRHLLRLWLAGHTPRPVVPETRIYNGEGVPAQAGRTPSYATDVDAL